METSKFEERLQRIMDAAGAKSDSDLARALGIQPPSVAAARKREQVPSGWVEQVAERFGVSADWLLFGESRGATGGRPIRQAKATPATWTWSTFRWWRPSFQQAQALS